jgi:hypothetical protein
MILTKAEAQHLQQTLLSPGWELVKRLAEEKIEEAKMAALVNTEWSKAEELWRRAQVADAFLRVFTLEVENPQAGIGQE